MSPVRAASVAIFGEPDARTAPRAMERQASSAADRLTRFGLLMALGVGVIVFAGVSFSPHLFEDGDTFWHLAAGDWMLKHRAILHADPFSYTAAGKAWDTHEWLTEVLMTPVWRWLGWPGLQLMFALAAAATAAIMAGEIQRRLALISSLATIALALTCTEQSWLARPHLLALPLLALWTVQLVRASEAGRTPPLWLVPLMTVWANLHGSFLIGLALTGPIALEAVLAAGAARLRMLREWALFLTAAVAAALITPHGFGGLLHPIQIQSMKTLQHIQEWRGADFGQVHPFELALLAALYVMLSRGVKIPMVRLLTLLGLMHLALHEVRHQMVFAVIAPVLLAEPLGRALRPEGPPQARPAPSPKQMTLALAGLACAAFAVAAIRLSIPETPKDSGTAPAAALAHVPAALRAQPVLNEYGMGGFLIFNGVRPFIDGRADMYGDAFFEAYIKALEPDRARLTALLARYKVRWTILDPKDPGVQLMDMTPGWKRLYADKSAVVHVRTGA